MEQNLKRARIEEDELSKLRKTIIEEGINKINYTSDESEINSSSDDEVMVKFLPKQKSKQKLDVTLYAFQLNNKMSKLRSELARNEERLRYLQLDYNNKEIKIEDLQLELIKNKEDLIKNKEELIINKNIITLLSKDKNKNKNFINFLIIINIISTTITIFVFINK